MRIVKYGAEWCGPCKSSTLVLKDAGLQFEDINVEENEELVEQKGIRNIPVIEFYKDNNNTDVYDYRHVGLLTKTQLDSILDSLK